MPSYLTAVASPSAPTAAQPESPTVPAEVPAVPAVPVEVEPTYAGWVTPATLSDPNRGELAEAVRATAATTDSAPAVAAALWWKRYSWFVVQAAIEGWHAGDVPDLDPDRSRVRLSEEPPYVEIEPAATWTAPAGGDRDCAAWLAEHVVDGHLRPIVDGLHALTRSGKRLLWGSVAHAIAYPVFVRRCADLEGGAGSAYAAVAAEAFLDQVGKPVAGLIGFALGERGEVEPRRRTCCLAFRSGTPVVCGYCPIATARETAAKDGGCAPETLSSAHRAAT